MANNATRIANILMQHNLDLLSLEANERAKVRRMLNSLETDVLKKLEKFNPTETPIIRVRNKRMNTLISAVGDDIDEAYERIAALMDESAIELIDIESEATAKAINSQIKVDLVSGRLNREVVRGLASSLLIEGAPSGEWWADQNRILRNKFVRQVRMGVFNNEPIQQIARRIRGTRANGYADGIMEATRKQAENLVRSSVMTVANEARMETFRQNNNVIKGVQWQSTLDSRTTPICIALDGASWTLDGRRLNGTSASWRGPPPAHFACRSTLTPLTKSYAELSKDPKIRKKLEQLEGNRKRSVRASMDGAVSEDLKYPEWLKGKEEKEKARGVDVTDRFAYKKLGPAKYKLWTQDKLSLSELIDQSHNPLTVKALRKKLGITN